MKSLFESRLLASATLVFLVGIFLSSYSQFNPSQTGLMANLSAEEKITYQEPYIHFKDKNKISPLEIRELENKVIQPIVSYKQTLNTQVAYVLVDRIDEDTFSLNVISASPGDSEPTYEQITSKKVDGEIINWTPINT